MGIRFRTSAGARVYTRGRPVARTALASGLLLAASACNIFSIEDDAKLGLQAYDEILEGQPLVTNYMNYLMPTASDVPDTVKGEVVTPSPFTPLGAKGCGEGAIHTTPATIMNAINDALAPLGTQATEVPASPLRVWKLIRDAEK